ncbi:MAG: 23S rRNA (pseudouridine(1915)-N(3))-methyltransferase RlmH [Bacteroidaceae bacterium]|nr:23S rRNA (pseudouridine(1915)-N(3))-methyltransferase RlmH [Bacteroidaceae bacterium]
MKILLLAVGKTDDRYLRTAVDDYVARAAHYLPLEVRELPDIRDVRHLTHDQQRQLEGEQLLRQLQPGDYVVLLDEAGRTYTSAAFAQWLQQRMNTVPRRLVFIIGGPYGFSPAVYDAAHARLSLSPMTFSHQMVRLIFTEQLYRALTILHNQPYHHG